MSAEARPLGESDFTRFRELVQRTSGIELSEVRRSDLERAVQRTAERMSMHGPAQLHAHLSHADSAVDLEAFIAELTIGETYFFRHRAQFDALERTILPDLIARRSQERRLGTGAPDAQPERSRTRWPSCSTGCCPTARPGA